MIIRDILNMKGGTIFSVAPDGKVSDAVKMMVKNDIGSLVVMAKGHLAGMLTFREVLAALAKGAGSLGATRVSEIYEREPLTATPTLDVMELRGRMLDRHARYVPVLDGDMLLGVVSFHDVAKAVYEEQSFENRMLKSYIEDSPTTGAR